MTVKNITTKAKPSEDTKAFCVYLISPIYLIIYIAKVIFLRFCLATLRIIINFVIHRRIAA